MFLEYTLFDDFFCRWEAHGLRFLYLVGLVVAELVGYQHVEFDVAGPAKLGLRAFLVRTGKYRPGDEDRFQIQASEVLDSLTELPERLGCV